MSVRFDCLSLDIFIIQSLDRTIGSLMLGILDLPSTKKTFGISNSKYQFPTNYELSLTLKFTYRHVNSEKGWILGNTWLTTPNLRAHLGFHMLVHFMNIMHGKKHKNQQDSSYLTLTKKDEPHFQDLTRAICWHCSTSHNHQHQHQHQHQQQQQQQQQQIHMEVNLGCLRRLFGGWSPKFTKFAISDYILRFKYQNLFFPSQSH